MRKKFIALLLTSAFPLLAFGHGSTIDAVNDSVVAVLKTFKETETDAIKATFRGIKAWPKDEMIMAKIYLLEGQVEKSLNYMCMMDHTGENDKMACQKQ
ncbi:MAG: hypothetical protein SGJ18_16330 [Pseudomonadota bacterium]|nr:hypothetical protein [Pseudomonadota bacterium]